MGRKKTQAKRIVAKSATAQVYETMRSAAGEDVMPVVNFLRGKRDISEFQIAENIRAEVGWVRQMLYRLQTQNLVTYFRKKDRIKGWYISYWTLNTDGARHLAVKMERGKVEDLKERLERELKYQGLFYICPSFCTRMVFDEATDIDFKCPECGKVMNSQDNSKTIERLQERIKEMGK